MLDLCVLQYRRLATLAGCDMLAVGPTWLVVSGNGVDGAVEVLVNGIASPEFHTLDDDAHLAVRLPPALEQAVIREVKVYVSAPGNDTSAELNLVLSGATCIGLARLAQLVVKLLLTTQGSDIFDPTSGASAKELRDLSVSDTTGIAGAAQQKVALVQAQILAAQASLKLVSSETLRSIQILGVTTDVPSRNIGVSLLIVAADGAVALNFPIEATT